MTWFNKLSDVVFPPVKEEYIDFELLDSNQNIIDAFSLTKTEANKATVFSYLGSFSSIVAEIIAPTLKVEKKYISIYPEKKDKTGAIPVKVIYFKYVEEFFLIEIKSKEPLTEKELEEFYLEDDLNPYEQNSWGDDWHCIRCGSKLEHIAKDDEWWGDFCWNYMKKHGTLWFLCDNKKCCHNTSPLVLHNPAGGWRTPAGDSYAIGWVK